MQKKMLILLRVGSSAATVDENAVIYQGIVCGSDGQWKAVAAMTIHNKRLNNVSCGFFIINVYKFIEWNKDAALLILP